MNSILLSILEHPLFAPVREIMRRIVPYRLRYSVHARAVEQGKQRAAAAALVGGRSNLDDIARLCAEDAQPVAVPLVMISQIQRSGGTLLSQLFDNHSQILAHPQELKIGYPEKFNWPNLMPGMAADEAFDILFERTNVALVEQGYTKGNRDTRRYRFFLPPVVQKQVFLSAWAAKPPQSARDILNAYFTSYFNGWLNYRGSIAKARYITAFVPRMAHDAENVRKFFEAYTDGRLISVLREPTSWFASAKGHTSKSQMFGEVESAIKFWEEGAQAILRNKKAYGDRVLVISFEALAGNTEATMREVSRWLGIVFEPALLQPTFNGDPIGANSSFDDIAAGVDKSVADRGERVAAADRAYIERHAAETYRQAKAVVDI